MAFTKKSSARRAKLIDKPNKTPKEVAELAKLDKAMELWLMKRMGKLSKRK